MTRSLLALRKVTPPAPEPVAGETLVYAADQHAGLAYVLSSYLSETDETDTHRTAALLADALQRQATLLRAFMGEPDDAEAEAPIGGPMDTSDAATEAPE